VSGIETGFFASEAPLKARGGGGGAGDIRAAEKSFFSGFGGTKNVAGFVSSPTMGLTGGIDVFRLVKSALRLCLSSIALPGGCLPFSLSALPTFSNPINFAVGAGLLLPAPLVPWFITAPEAQRLATAVTFPPLPPRAERMSYLTSASRVGLGRNGGSRPALAVGLVVVLALLAVREGCIIFFGRAGPPIGALF
jgi:hypothetical protein